jgi:hypothetical protein
MRDDHPLILTLQIDDQSFSFFNTLRKTHFPPALNYLDAHLTLFHHLPSGELSIEDDLKVWSREQTVLTLQVTEVKSIGKGVAYKIECPALTVLHKRMQNKWSHWLTPQDKQKLWPHITVQNKVSPAEARNTLAVLQASFQPFTGYGLGFHLWSYEGGPWRFRVSFPFVQP